MTPAALAVAAPVGRDEAQRAAERELSKGIYAENAPGPVERAVDAVLRWLQEQLFGGSGLFPGGGLGLVVLALLIGAAVAFVMWRVGPGRRGAGGSSVVVELPGPLDPAEHRRRAEAYAAGGRYADAVRERMRAVVRELETRGVLEPRPGRTADEVAREAGALVPAVAPDLRTAAGVFDEIWFGGRPATAEADALLRQADQRVQRAQLAVTAGVAGGGHGGYEVPR